MRNCICLLFLLTFSFFANAQRQTITGKIVDSSGAPVPGASVQMRGGATGTAADAQGNFRISAQRGDVLTISAVGFSTQTVTIGDQINISVTLSRSVAVIDEVVVTALGQGRSRSRIGYSATTVNSEALNRTAPVGLLDAMGGKVAGANISNVGGPGASTKVVLRGYGIIGGGNNQPLYVIDGIPLSDAQPQLNGNTDFGNGMTSLNPNDVESITVLKGTAASSLYGSTAKNGAIMITTKRGRAGKLRVDYNGSINLSYVGKLPDYQDQFGQGWGGQFILSENGSWGPKFDGQMRPWGATVDNSQLIKPFVAIKDNLRKFYDVGTEWNNSIGLSGGNENSRFYFSYGNVTSDGVIPTNTDYLQRNTFSLRTNSNYGKLSMNTSFNYVNRKLNVPFTGQGGSDGQSVFESILQIPVDIPISDLRLYQNKFFNVDNYFTPYAENPYYALYENYNTQNSDRFFGNVDLNYKFTTSFSTQLRLGGDFTNARTKGFKQPNAPSPGSWNAGNNVEGASRAPDVGSVFEGSDYYGLINGDLILKYNRDLNPDWNLDALLGGNYYQSQQRNVASQITNLTIPGFANLSNTSLPPTTSDFNSLRRRIGVYAQATLGYKNQVFVTGNARNDWSSTLPIDNNSFFYPGVTVSWLASRTLNLGNSSLSYLKLRGGYGKTGSDPNPYLLYPTLVPGTVGLGFGSLIAPFNGVSAFGISNSIGNQNLKPIITKELELGVEARFLKNRFGLDVTYYNKTTEGQIFTVPIAPSTGYTGLVQNIGTVNNKGIEVTADGKIIDGRDFTWSLTYTFSKNWNKVQSLTGTTPVIINTAYDAEIRAVIGQPVAEMYAPVPQMSPDGRIVVNPQTGMPLAAAEKGDYGSTQYDYMMGLNNTLTYKSWQLGFSLDFRNGGVMYSGTSDLVLFVGNGIKTTYNDRRPFIVPNSVNAITDASGKTSYVENTTPIDVNNITNYYYPTSNPGTAYYQRIIDRSFLKLRDITLTWSLPRGWASAIRASSLSVGIYGRNILLWTPASNVYIDPEASNLGNDLGSELGEFRQAPISKQFGLSVRASF
jgi:TonB-linked SusC/RagA family outer membrane protein